MYRCGYIDLYSTIIIGMFRYIIIIIYELPTILGSPPLTKRIEALGTRMDCTVPVSKEGIFFFREFRFLLSRVC